MSFSRKSLVNHSDPQVLFEDGAKEDVNVSQCKKVLKASEKRGFTGFVCISVLKQYKSNSSSCSLLVCFVIILREKQVELRFENGKKPHFK